MTDIRMTEVSGVDRAANLVEGWLVMKDASPETARLLARAEALAKGLNPDALDTTEIDTMKLSEDVRKGLDPTVVAYIESLEETVTKAAPTASTAPTAETEAEKMEKALAALPEDLRKAVASTQRQAAEALEFAKAAKDREEVAFYTTFAKSVDKVATDGTPEEFGVTLRKAASGDKEAFGLVLKALGAANETLRQSALFKEVGSGAADDNTTATGQLTAMAKSFIAADPKLDMDAAFRKACGENPHLYAGYRAESQNGAN